ncbi:MAG TPA: diguanylate cyclase, partial [Acidimicrobiales bacterium]|nr:diguanylate cyclase [Acidimicrobiales bacterium]
MRSGQADQSWERSRAVPGDDDATFPDAFYQELLETAPDGVVVADDDGIIRLVNRQAEVLFGWGRGQLIGQPLEILIPHRVREVHPKHRAGFMAKPTTRPMAAGFNLNACRSDGSELPVDISLSPLNIAGRVWVSAAVRDATARMAAEDALRNANEQLTATVAELERRSGELALLNEMGDLLQSCLTSEEAGQVIASFAARVFPDAGGALYLPDQVSSRLDLEIVWGSDNLPQAATLGPEDCWALRRGRPYWSLDRLACRHALDSPATHTMCLPLIAQGIVLGLVCFTSDTAAETSRSAEDALGRVAPTIAEHISLALANVRLRETLQARSIHDALTGLYNRRHLDERIEAAVAAANRRREPLSLLAIDIDHFKRYNDGRGHAAGDEMLRRVADTIRSGVRPTDLVFRPGGDEFIVLLPETSSESAHHRAEAICAAIASQDDIPITASVGVA